MRRSTTLTTMRTINAISTVAITILIGVVTIGLPIFSCIRDSKGLEVSTAPVCLPGERFEDCLPPLPPLPEEVV
jgi:hypothetical protein